MVLGDLSEKTFVFGFELSPDALAVLRGAMVSQDQIFVTCDKKYANFLS
jgi:hypothetical protein